jgi:hypothetical protein
MPEGGGVYYISRQKGGRFERHRLPIRGTSFRGFIIANVNTILFAEAWIQTKSNLCGICDEQRCNVVLLEYLPSVLVAIILTLPFFTLNVRRPNQLGRYRLIVVLPVV